MKQGKPFVIICWLCRTVNTVSGQRNAEKYADTHGLAKHRRSDWMPFMECQTIESVVAEGAEEQ